ncbi:T9SS type A sorting domain-containing protein [Chryseobacterium turcicum]|uniref:T9SS type A sorting domain-containing protein n=1 Tax=Chryseobacterium turcicum TaxID=2898076 RepID=A0A9Q3V4H7_9FLAO|nr:T9SS type A sorting domain-containing protein [Chryseobacterium turcicum]MCD1118022.1 T9SS type A sorting domain-containing protein [Chryseobacterium turcicum]
MKKTLLSCFAIIAVAANAQISVVEGFESTTFPPTGWSYPAVGAFSRTTTAGYPCTGSAAAWKKLSGTIASTMTSYLMYSSNGSNGNAIAVNFNYSAKKSSSVYVTNGNMLVEYSVNGGNTWNILGNQVDFISETNCTAFTATIPSGAVPLDSDFRFRITGTKTTPPTGTADWYLTVDDITLTQAATCYMPNNITASTVTTNTATIDWVAPSFAPANGYEYYYSLNSTPPLSTTAPSGVSAVTTANLSSLQPSSTYNVWVRSVCSATDKSPWSALGNFTTDCAPISSLFENFDSYITGNIVPKCWNRIMGAQAGAQTITNSNTSSGSRSISMTSSSAVNYSIVVLPEFNNVNAGTHQLRMKTKVTTGTGSLDIGYVTNPTNASSFVNIQTITPDTNYTDYTVVIPTSVPSTARLAIRNNGTTTRSHFWDDIYWEASSALSTHDVSSNPKFKVYPNPFTNVVNLSDVENIKSIIITTASGQMVKEIYKITKEITLSDLNVGLYIFTVKYNNGEKQHLKILKK